MTTWAEGHVVVVKLRDGMQTVERQLRCVRTDQIPLDPKQCPVIPWYRLAPVTAPPAEIDPYQVADFHQDPHRIDVQQAVVFEADYQKLNPTPYRPNYGTSGPPVQRKAMKDWPHDCPRCKGRECALQLATTWDCRNGCFK